MSIRTIAQFKKFCRKLDEASAMDFEKESLKEHRDGVFTYETTHRDADNYKAKLVVTWNSRSWDLSWDTSHPEAADVIENLLAEFEPKRPKRSFVVYAKIRVEGVSDWSSAARVVQKKLDDLHYTIHDTARSAQFS